MPDFNQEAPPASVTNPKGLPAGGEYPKTLYKAGEGKNAVVVAWEGDTAISNCIVTVGSADDERKKAKDGYGPDPVLEAPKK